MGIDEQLAGELESLIVEECQLYRDYLTLLDEERGWFKNFNADRVERSTLRRAGFLEKMRDCQEMRIKIMRRISPVRGENLRNLVVARCTPAQASRILPLCEELRGLAQRIEEESCQHSQVVHFALKTVHGLLSILWSASKSVLKAYDRKGSAYESYQPVKSRLSGILKRA